MSSRTADLDVVAQRRRLAWGCRRGMLELDELLRPLAERLDQLDADELAAAAELLASTDDELWDMLVLRRRVPAPEQQALLAAVHAGEESHA